ncbi:DUF1521 domain-containing protein [Luteimonas soli]|uniref:DUF1521 domain-containing protein n=1 Tax=Luteimonas soli TaxID=1648966 RepID=A0ABV7XLZ5_9GAMM
MGDFISGNFNFSATESIAAGGCVGRGEGPSTSRTSDGKVQFENDNYRITADDNNEVTIFNKQTGENYRIWGDPHVEIDGKHAFDFWGNTTFVLDDGTRVSIATTPWDKGNNGATVASQVVIVDGGGQYATHIQGVDSNTTGDLGFYDIEVGEAAKLEVTVTEGNVIEENENGRGFVAVGSDGELQGVDQAFINATDEVKQHGTSVISELASIFQHFSGVVSLSLSGSFFSFSGSFEIGEPEPEAQPVAQVDYVPGQEEDFTFRMTMVHA